MAKQKSFFKFYIPATSAKCLKLPVAYSLQLQGDLPERAFLRDCYTNTWAVKMTKVGNDWFFEDGWEKFVQDNSMEYGDVCIFLYNGKNIFDVKLMGLSGCDKEGVGGSRISALKDEENRRADHAENEHDRVDEDYEQTEEKDYVQTEEEADEDVEAKEHKVEDCNGDYVDSIEGEMYIQMDQNRDDPDEDGEEEQVADYGAREEDEIDTTKDYVGVNIQAEEMEQETEEDGEEEVEQVVKDKDGHRKVRRRLSRVDPYGEDIFISGLAPQPRNPYFVTRTRKKRPNELFIPRETLNDFQLTLPNKLFLIDPEGRKWEAKLCPWKDGRPWYRGGWKSLCKANFIREEDRCICEFVKEEGQEGLSLHVRIIKAGNK